MPLATPAKVNVALLPPAAGVIAPEMLKLGEGGLLFVPLARPAHPPSPSTPIIRMESTAQCWNARSNLDMGVEVRFSALAAWLRLIDPRKEEKHGRIAQTNTVTFSLSMN